MMTSTVLFTMPFQVPVDHSPVKTDHFLPLCTQSFPLNSQEFPLSIFFPFHQRISNIIVNHT